MIDLDNPTTVDWPDGSLLRLHPLTVHGVPCSLHRAVRVDGQWALLDLEAAWPDLADDIRQHLRRDHHGLLRFTLRGRFGGAAACVAWLRPHLQALPASVSAPAAEAA